ncbi:ABC transporter permease [Nakamurella flavida]|uniref:Xylose transport system permease protein XylH n=1 Tax=Nakamurella flavida TaxID=363630 RepID=A0A939C361_9ACTN|nr:ABC transporter permease [Nakamurella flavida]MBM9477300.1 ABC transporter permease [Nakamurella flavida]MDP9779756.1 simple sugar transport system permease protein [Nakamurella flavida]
MSSSLKTPPPSSTSATVTSASPKASLSLGARLMARPEIGALIAAVAIYAFFFIVAPPFRSIDAFATILYASSQVGIVAVAVGLLMIGGEFDLSAGVAFITAALTASIFSYQFSVNMWLGSAVALVLALGIGFVNGYLVVKTGIPSFLITLGTFFILQGANLGITKLVTGSVATQNVSDIDGFGSLKAIFDTKINLFGANFRITVLWWVLFVAIATWILARTRIGNWIFAVGGNAPSARAVGVPVNKVKIGLFMAVGFLAWFYGQHRLYGYNTIQAGEGVGQEFIYIIAAVVGGTLLTGGFGSAIGTAIGAFIFGMVSQGIVYAGWDPNWFKAFLGVMLLLAVAVNLYVKKLATTRRSV